MVARATWNNAATGLKKQEICKMMKTYADFGIEIPYGRVSGKIKCYCPKCHQDRHDKRDKSLSVDLDKGVWHCHYCGWSGTINHLEEWEKDYRRGLYQLRNMQVRKQPKTYKKPKPRNVTPFEPRALAWFKGRGISEKTLNDLKVTEGMEFMPQNNALSNTVQFNYYRNGELINTKFRTGDKKFKLCSGAELLPYNIDCIKGKKDCIITEGEMDCLSFWEIGYRNVISVPNGANANLEYLDDYIEDYFDDKETIYIASDTDTKGVLLRDELIHRFGAERCRVLDYGADCKDGNEVLMKHGREALKRCVEEAPEVKVEGVFTLSDFEDNLDALLENGLHKGVTIGHDNFDKLCSFETKRLCVVTGIPGSGKSEFIDEISERLNIRYNWRFAYFSPENAPLEYHAAKLIEKFTGKKFKKGNLTPEEYKEVKERLQADYSFIAPSDYKLGTILEKAKFLVRKRGIKCLVIDPYNRLEDEQGNMNETRYVSHVLDLLQNFAQQNDVLVILMAHPTKQPKNKDGVIEAPTLYDISGSANFYNKADFGLVVHRNRLDDTVEVHVQKVKFRHLGECGTALFKYNLNNGRYVPYYNGVNPLWDNSNHLTEERHRREKEIAESSTFDFESDPFTPPEDECPF